MPAQIEHSEVFQMVSGNALRRACVVAGRTFSSMAGSGTSALLCFSAAAPLRSRLHRSRALGRSRGYRPVRPRSNVPPAFTCSLPDASASKHASKIPLPAAVTVSVEIAPGKVISFETGRVARQAAGSVMARQGDTLVLCTSCAAFEPESGADFLPLRVDYGEKFSAVGRTSGSYIKREGRPTEHETLCSRLIDRPLRPMFEDGYWNEVQLLAYVMSYDGQYPGDPLAICGCAAALHISEIPLKKAVAAVRVAKVGDEFVINPSVQECEKSDTLLVIAGTRNAILMIEGSCGMLPEEEVLEAVIVAQAAIAKICDCIDELREKVGVEKVVVKSTPVSPALLERISAAERDLDVAISIAGKQERGIAMSKVKDKVLASIHDDAVDGSDGDASFDKSTSGLVYKRYVSSRIREKIFATGIRADGRDCATVRPITIDQGLLPGAHGSSLFTRGETQALAVATLGDESMAQRFETLDGENAARFYLQYSFPPSSVGEVGRVGAPGRREVGHGKLAERALAKVMPSRSEFPYVVRVESTITESCGSSSMASVCGGCLALMDAGVPISEVVAGIAMGLLLDEDSGRYVILTDILGLEDALGDMDFKVAGSELGITALQMDIKVEGLSIDILREALEHAKRGRLHILREMCRVQPEPSSSLPTSLPKMRSLSIPINRIGEVIGPGGRKIKSVIEQCGGETAMNINIADDGTVSFASSSETMIEKAMTMVKSMVVSLEVGTKVEGVVTKVLPFGAYIGIGSGKEGWLHISELEEKRTSSVEDVVKVGDKCVVQVIEVGRNGQCRVSRKACLAKSETFNSTEQK